MNSLRAAVALLLVVTVATLFGVPASAQKEVSIGYQLVYNPWKVAISTGAFETATGYKIKWKMLSNRSKSRSN